MMISDSCALRTEIRSAARGGDWELRLCMYDYDITEKKAVGERPELALPPCPTHNITKGLFHIRHVSS